jgi:hypothetical protein
MAGRAKRNTILNKHQFGLETDKNSEEGGGGYLEILYSQVCWRTYSIFYIFCCKSTIFQLQKIDVRLL